VPELLFHPGKAYSADSPSSPGITWQDEGKGAVSKDTTGPQHDDFKRARPPTRPGYRANPFASRPTHTFLCRACAGRLKLTNAFHAVYDTMIDPPDIPEAQAAIDHTGKTGDTDLGQQFVAAIVVDKDVPLHYRHVCNPDSQLRDARDRPIGKSKQLAFTAGDATIVLNDGGAYWRSRYVKGTDGAFATRHEIFNARANMKANTDTKSTPQHAGSSAQQPSPPPVQQPTQNAAAPDSASDKPPTTDKPTLAVEPPQHAVRRLYYAVVRGLRPGIYDDADIARVSAQGDAANTVATFLGKRAAQAFFSEQQTLGHVDWQRFDSKAPPHTPDFIEHDGPPDKPEKMRFSCPRCHRKYAGMYLPGMFYCQDSLCKAKLNLN
jgi:hypothetical protein